MTDNHRAVRSRIRRQIAKAQDYLERRPDASAVSEFIAELEDELRELEQGG